MTLGTTEPHLKACPAALSRHTLRTRIQQLVNGRSFTPGYLNEARGSVCRYEHPLFVISD
jgi:hypothetical protein